VNTSDTRRLSLAWIAVVTVTLIYLAIDGSADDHGLRSASTAASIAAITLALAKVRIIMRELMGVRHAPTILRRLTDALVVVMGALLLGTCLIGTAIA